MASTITIHVRYFASVRERLGAGESVDLPVADLIDGSGGAGSRIGGVGVSGLGLGRGQAGMRSTDVPRTVGELRAWLIARSEHHAAALDLARGLRMAYNQTLCGPDQPLESGAEVAFFPPVTGG